MPLRLELVVLANEQTSKLYKWRGQFGALVIAFTCLIVLITSCNDNWVLTCILGLSVFVCGTISFFDLKQGIYNKSN